MPFRFTFETWAIDCDLSASSVITADYYDESQRLVDVASVPNSAALTFTPIQVQSPLKKALKYVCAPQAADQDQQKDSGEPSLYTGTAWLGPKGYLITASHVVRGATAIVVGQDGHPVGEAEVVVDDPSNDVAILRPAFDKPGLHPLIDLAASPAKLGEHVFTLGYPAPDALGTSVKLTSGEISGLNGSDLIHARVDDARLLQISVPIQHGNSGGPILDERGQAVGVVVTGFPLDGEAAMQNVNYAIKIGYVRSLLADLPDIGGYRLLKPSASVTGLATDLRNSIFMLVVA